MLLLEDLTLKEIPDLTPKPKRKPRLVKNGAVLIVIDESGAVTYQATQRVDVVVIRKGAKKPTPLCGCPYTLAFTAELVEGKDFKLRAKRKGTPMREWKTLDWSVMSKLGITAKLNIKGAPHHRLVFPANILPSHRTYTPDEQVLMHELLIAGAVWCGFNGRHFLAVLPT